MASVGGDIIEVTYNHSTLGSGIFLPKANEDSTFDLGGPRTDDEQSGVTSSGDMITKMTNTRWSFEVPIAWDSKNRKDLETLIALHGNPVDANWTITLINGSVYSGKGRPVGETPGNGNAATIKLKIAGGGSMQKIA